MLRNTISRLSYRSFSRLAEAFTSHTPPGIPSPQLAKLALTMELTRKVAGINSHAVHTIMGYSLQYMDMFVPWLQQQGGWVRREAFGVGAFFLDWVGASSSKAKEAYYNKPHKAKPDHIFHVIVKVDERVLAKCLVFEELHMMTFSCKEAILQFVELGQINVM